ncbi:MAG: hypothetical protein LBJ38_02510 [Oscillospiraceae bacterium]|jgi:hypothetical protein|nr:hypothetical protein [Oscillospiraceae bacterium]
MRGMETRKLAIVFLTVLGMFAAVGRCYAVPTPIVVCHIIESDDVSGLHYWHPVLHTTGPDGSFRIPVRPGEEQRVILGVCTDAGLSAYVRVFTPDCSCIEHSASCWKITVGEHSVLMCGQSPDVASHGVPVLSVAYEPTPLHDLVVSVTCELPDQGSQTTAVLRFVPTATHA